MSAPRPRRPPARLLVLAAAAAVAVGAGLWLILWRGPEPARHAVVVVFDTLRADRMSVYGYGRETTPFFAAAAPDFLRFAAAKAPAPWTVPTHASLFTGLWPAEHRARWGHMVLDARFETVAERLGAHGFRTVGFTANPLVVRSTGLDQGFESFKLVRGPWPERTETILSLAPEEIDTALAEGRRLFLFLNLMDAHIPYNTRRYGEREGVEGPGPIHNATVKWEVSAGARPFTEEMRRLHGAAYDAAVRYLDDVGRDLLALLAEKGILEETVVVFTSDHGDGLGTHAEIDHTISVWEEQLAVPLLVRLPGRRRGGEVVVEKTTLTAVAPTLFDWLGLERPPALAAAPDLDGATGWPVLADYRSYFAETNRKTNRNVAERYPELAARIQDAHVLYCGRMKLIVRGSGETELYDLEADPDELTDLAPEAPRELRSCAGSYRAVLEAGLLTPFGVDAGSPEEEPRVDLETLRALGYVQ